MTEIDEIECLAFESDAKLLNVLVWDPPKELIK